MQSLARRHMTGAPHVPFTQMSGIVQSESAVQAIAFGTQVLPWQRMAPQFVTMLHLCPVGQSPSIVHWLPEPAAQTCISQC
jgi:hypothetical protein